MQSLEAYGVMELTVQEQSDVVGGGLISEFTATVVAGVGAAVGAVVVVAKAIGTALDLEYVHL